MNKFEYRAFITYSHADAKAAAWLQRALENYRVPSRMVGKMTPHGAITRRLGAVFRDRSELSAGDDLSNSLTAALGASEWLIVVCSPAARQSRWVNLEIERFRQIHANPKILCFIVAGEPHASNEPGREQLECFPAALGFLAHGGAGPAVTEPIAADSRPAGDGKRLAKLKIIAGILGVGLNALIRRDSQRRQRNLAIITIAALAGMLAFAYISFMAVDARKNEELRRAEAEDLIEFMLSDLRNRLEAVGRLDVMDAVGKKAIQYYSNEPLAAFSEASLGRRARAFHLLGEVDDLRGSTESARASFEEAFKSTAELLERSPDNSGRIFDHAQSVFWIGYLDWHLGHYAAAESSFIEYIHLSQRLVDQEPDNAQWQAELGSAYANMGVYLLETNSLEAAVTYFELGRTTKTLAVSLDPGNDQLKLNLADTYAWLSDTYRDTGKMAEALAQREAELAIYEEVLQRDPGNQAVNQSLLTTHSALARLAVRQGDFALAGEHYDSALELGEGLQSLDPENTFTLQQSAAVYEEYARLLIFDGQYDRGSPFLERSDALMTQLLDHDSGVLEWKLQWYSGRVPQALLLAHQNDKAAAVSELQKSVGELHALAGKNSDVREIPYILAECYLTLAYIRNSQSEHDASLGFANRVVAELQSTGSELPPAQLDVLAQAYRLLGDGAKEKELSAYLESIQFKQLIFWPQD